MDKKQAREILKATHYGDKDKSIKLIDEAIDYLLTLPEVIYCQDCKHDLTPQCEMLHMGQEVAPRKDDYCSYGEAK